MAVETLPPRSDEQRGERNLYIARNPFEFVDSFSNAARKAGEGDFVFAQSMRSAFCDPFAEMVSAMEQAHNQGAKAEYHTDVLSKQSGESYFDLLKLPGPKRDAAIAKLQAQNAFFAQMPSRGIDTVFTNIPKNAMLKMVSIFGKNHIKVAGVVYKDHPEDSVVWIGGVNFFDTCFEATDVMVETKNPKAVEEIGKIFTEIDSHKPTKDRRVALDTDTELLVSAGKPFTDIIIDDAVELINAAQHNILISSPILTDGRVQKALERKAGEGVKIDNVTQILMPATEHFEAMTFRMSEVFMRLRGYDRKVNVYFHNKTLHLKCIVADGRYAIVGSDNFSVKGPTLSTQEAALKTRDPQLVATLAKTIEDTIDNSTKVENVPVAGPSEIFSYAKHVVSQKIKKGFANEVHMDLVV